MCVQYIPYPITLLIARNINRILDRNFLGLLPCLVPLRLLHFFGLSLCGEDETGSQRGHGPFSDSLLGVPDCVKDVVKERLHLLKEESGGAHSQLPQHQHLEKRVSCPIN